MPPAIISRKNPSFLSPRFACLARPDQKFSGSQALSSAVCCNTPGDHPVKDREPRPTRDPSLEENLGFSVHINARDKNSVGPTPANIPLPVGDQLGESGLKVPVGNWAVNYGASQSSA